jgi:rubrerythrin
MIKHPKMKTISRRQFLYFSAFFSVSNPFSSAFVSTIETCADKGDQLPLTIAVLKTAYKVEMIAHKNYICCTQKAVEDRYPNIAYLFTSFSVSEKIHAENYKRLLKSLCIGIEEPEIEIVISDTKSNLKNASGQELLKIKKTYPDFVKKLEKESYDSAVLNCMYSWKSHRQHEKKNESSRYAGIFFSGVAKRIEGMKFDFHICEICGSTIDEPPKSPCEICNYSLSHYRKVIRPS